MNARSNLITIPRFACLTYSRTIVTTTGGRRRRAREVAVALVVLGTRLARPLHLLGQGGDRLPLQLQHILVQLRQFPIDRREEDRLLHLLRRPTRLLLGRAAAERDAVPELRQLAHDRGRLGHGEHVVHLILHLPPGAEDQRRTAMFTNVQSTCL
jgi:hypothetical protein